MKLMAQSECNAIISNCNQLGNQTNLRDQTNLRHICAYNSRGRNDKSISGGLLQFFSHGSSTTYIIGIASSSGDCNPNSPRVYTRIDYYLDWIEPIVLL